MSRSMDMLRGAQIAEAGLTEWRKLAQGLHARYLADFATGVRFLAAVGEAGDEIGHHPRVTIGQGHVDLELVTGDAISVTRRARSTSCWVTHSTTCSVPSSSR